MKEFDVTITEILERTIKVQAETKEEATEEAELQWDEGKHVLDADDFKSSNFRVVGERDRTLNVLFVEPLQPPKEIIISDSLSELQRLVEGNIECIYPFSDPVIIIANEEAKINNLKPNRGIYQDDELVDIVAGSFLIVGDGEESFESLTPEMIEKYSKEYEKPEKFYQLAGKIVAQKIELPKEKDTKPLVNER